MEPTTPAEIGHGFLELKSSSQQSFLLLHFFILVMEIIVFNLVETIFTQLNSIILTGRTSQLNVHLCGPTGHWPRMNLSDCFFFSFLLLFLFEM